MILGQFPVLHQLILMDDRPGQHQLELTRRQRAADDAGVYNVNQCFLSVIFCVKMGRRVVIVMVTRIPKNRKISGMQQNLL